jgi:plastocyanin
MSAIRRALGRFAFRRKACHGGADFNQNRYLRRMKQRAFGFLWLGMIAFGLGLPGQLPGAQTHLVQMGSYFFNPTNITVAQGDSIVWTNRTTTAHDSTQGAANTPTASRLWISPNVPALVGSYRFTFTNTGFYPYICLQHIALRPQQTGTVTVVGGNFAPAVALTSPAPGSRHPAPPNFQVAATATDPDGTVTNVLFTATPTGQAAIVLGQDSEAPYALPVTNLPPASYQFRAIAYDNLGISSTSVVVGALIALPAPLVLSNPIRQGNQFEFDLATTLGLTYIVEESAALEGPWAPVSTRTAAGASLKVSLPFETVAPTQRLYRAFIVP